MAFDFITTALNERRKQQLFRTRRVIDSNPGQMIEVEGQHYINFSSNDYLGMRQSTEVMQAWVDGISHYGGGSGASPLVTGYSSAHKQLEDFIATSLNREAVILFNSGFAANQALCQCLCNKKSTIISDKLMHASFIDGALASEAEFKRFKHNDMTHLSHILTSAKQDTLVATEGVFSMDGDAAPIEQMTSLCDSANTWLMVDDAHGFGVLGDTGMGTVQLHGLSQQQLPIVMATFGKAVGTAGAFIAGSQQLIDYICNFARHYIYSTAMPSAQAHATHASLLALKNTERRDILHTNITYFRQLASEAGIPLGNSQSAIQPVIIGQPELCLITSKKLRELGLWVSAIRAPTVPKGTDRLRITLTAQHQSRDIECLVDALQMVLLKNMTELTNA